MPTSSDEDSRDDLTCDDQNHPQNLTDDFSIGELSDAELETIESVSTESTPSMIGRYKLLEQVGEGGMGVVWHAIQQEPVKRSVALKLVRA